jgi:hypothetical protein
MDCVVDDSDRVSNCQIAEETPPDENFGDAVRLMVKRGLVTAGPAPQGSAVPMDHIWRFRIVLPPHRL